MQTVDISSLFQGSSSNELQKQFIGSEHSFAPNTTNLGSEWIAKEGTLVSRTAYASLWSWVQATQGAQLVTDAAWLVLQAAAPNGAVSVYSTGDGATTFRVPTVGSEGGFSRAKGVGITDPVLLNIGFDSQIEDHKHATPLGVSNTRSKIYLPSTNANPYGKTAGGLWGGSINVLDIPSTFPDTSVLQYLTSSTTYNNTGETHPKGQYSVVYIYTGADTAGLAPVPTLSQIMRGLNSHNVLYNTGHAASLLPVNQRAFDGNWAGLSVGDYGYDGWLKYSATHKAQVIELGDFEDIDYVISYDGVSVETIRPPNGIAEPWLVAVPFIVDRIDLKPSEGYGYWQAEDSEQKLTKSLRYFLIGSGVGMPRYAPGGNPSTTIFYPAGMRNMHKRPTLIISGELYDHWQYGQGYAITGGYVRTDDEVLVDNDYNLNQTPRTVTGVWLDASFTIADAGSNIATVG